MKIKKHLLSPLFIPSILAILLFVAFITNANAGPDKTPSSHSSQYLW